MSSAVFSTTAAQSRFFAFEGEPISEVCAGTGPQHSAFSTQIIPDRGQAIQSVINNQKSKLLADVTPASRLEAHPSPEMVSSGVFAIDALTGGLPRGCLSEICGPASSGRTTVLLAALAAATRRGEFCAVVDAGDVLDPLSVTAAGVELERLLWVRCGENSPFGKNSQRDRDTEEKIRCHPERRRFPAGAKDLARTAVGLGAEHSIEQLLRATDLLLESGGFGLIALDLGDLPPQTAWRIPLTTWFRFRRAVEHTPTVLLAIERQAIAGSCSSLLLKLGGGSARFADVLPHATRAEPALSLPKGVPAPHSAHTQLLTEIGITAEVVRLRLERKPARCAEIAFTSKTAWAG